MVAEESSSNGIGAEGSIGGFWPSVSEGLRTYKKRKLAKAAGSGSRSVEDGKVSMGEPNHSPDLAVSGPSDRILPNNSSLPRADCGDVTKNSKFCSLEHWRNVILEQICGTLSDSEGGLLGCLRDAIMYHPDINPANDVKTSVLCHGDKDSCFSQKQWMPESSHNAAQGYPSIMSNVTLDEADRQTNTKLCQRTFSSVIISEKFASLCKLLLENFQGIKFDNLFDFTLISSRMKEGAYEHSPMLFSLDIQQVWAKLEKISSEMLSLAKSLSEVSRNSCDEWIRASGHDTYEDGNQEFCNRESDSQAKLEQTGAGDVYKFGTCSHCEDTADGRDCLVCDSCEEMYHFSCTEPAAVGIPSRSWYCVNCTARGIGSPHENCVVCERLNGSLCAINEVGEDFVPTCDACNEREESPNNFREERETDLCCKICEGQVENGEKSMVCSHPYCYAKYYHVRCLTNKQLKSYGPCWYCPSCLCRVCLTDRDDDMIVLCDGCNHAYHTYCMEPPRASIPTGSWFCKQCDAGIQRIRRAKKKYTKLEKQWTNGAEEDELEFEDLEVGRENFGKGVSDKAEGMSMLLDAAKTLIHEEELAATR